ncbi:hypothetical protein X766_06530 [Mesorhizobium sp. LSJC255A00]|nr:hypothetical protein X766_06530 [Mesorhizobium sp. LSJC255A00]
MRSAGSVQLVELSFDEIVPLIDYAQNGKLPVRVSSTGCRPCLALGRQYSNDIAVVGAIREQDRIGLESVLANAEGAVDHDDLASYWRALKLYSIFLFAESG